MKSSIYISIAIIVVAICGLAAYYIYLDNNRFYLVKDEKGVVQEIDKKTGDSWYLHKGKKVAYENPIPQLQILSLPENEQKKITGQAGLSLGFFKGELYNGSNWIVKEVIFKIEITNKRGSTLSSREYRDEVEIKPLTTEKFIFKILEDSNIDNFTWGIIEIKGYKSNENK